MPLAAALSAPVLVLEPRALAAVRGWALFLVARDSPIGSGLDRLLDGATPL